VTFKPQGTSRSLVLAPFDTLVNNERHVTLITPSVGKFIMHRLALYCIVGFNVPLYTSQVVSL